MSLCIVFTTEQIFIKHSLFSCGKKDTFRKSFSFVFTGVQKYLSSAYQQINITIILLLSGATQSTKQYYCFMSRFLKFEDILLVRGFFWTKWVPWNYLIDAGVKFFTHFNTNNRLSSENLGSENRTSVMQSHLFFHYVWGRGNH